MKNTRPTLFVIILCFFCDSLFAQRDTSRLDAGWLSLDRSFTQGITVKGADLEKMPFANLADAIRAWFYGAYTVPGTLAYVVDGNPVTDVNLYPIYEIEEVTLVQNATGAAAYGSTQQDLVIVTTKRGKGRSGFRVAGQAGLVNANGNGVSTLTNVYHQYYVGGYQNLGKVSYGISAGWIRDVSPVSSESYVHVATPLNLQRWRFNGNVRWQPAETQSVEFRMGYAPERMDQALDSSRYAGEVSMANERVRAHLLAPQLHWNWEVVPGLRQELQMSYVGSSIDLATIHEDSNFNTQGTRVNTYGGLLQQRVNQFFANERLSYSLKKGGWVFRPAVNLSYNHIDEKIAYGTSTFNISGSAPVVVAPVLGPMVEQTGNLLFFSPALEVGFGRVVDLQAGVLMDLHPGSEANYKKALPFASLGVDVLGFGAEPKRASLKVFGSYAERSQLYVDDYSLPDLSGGGAPYSILDVHRPKYTYQYFSVGGGGTVDTIYSQLVPVQYPNRFRVYQAGIAFALGKVLRVSYSYERREFLLPGNYNASISSIPGQSLAIVPLLKSDAHHFDVRVRVTGEKALSWETGLGVTALRSRAYYTIFFPQGMFANVQVRSMAPTGDVDPAKFSWTGGFMNRLRVGSFEAGLDLLYHFGEGFYAYNQYGSFLDHKQNSVMTPNVYVGYHWKLAHGRMLEVFLDSRGLVRNKTSDLPDNRRYYTLGGSIEL